MRVGSAVAVAALAWMIASNAAARYIWAYNKWD